MWIHLINFLRLEKIIFYEWRLLYIVGHCIMDVINLNSMINHWIRKTILRGDGLSADRRLSNKYIIAINYYSIIYFTS